MHAAAHDADAEALLVSAPSTPERGPGGRWHHMELDGGHVRRVQRLPGVASASASVAAYRATDEIAAGTASVELGRRIIPRVCGAGH